MLWSRATLLFLTDISARSQQPSLPEKSATDEDLGGYLILYTCIVITLIIFIYTYRHSCIWFGVFKCDMLFLDIALTVSRRKHCCRTFARHDCETVSLAKFVALTRTHTHTCGGGVVQNTSKHSFETVLLLLGTPARSCKTLFGGSLVWDDHAGHSLEAHSRLAEPLWKSGFWHGSWKCTHRVLRLPHDMQPPTAASINHHQQAPLSHSHHRNHHSRKKKSSRSCCISLVACPQAFLVSVCFFFGCFVGCLAGWFEARTAFSLSGVQTTPSACAWRKGW